MSFSRPHKQPSILVLYLFGLKYLQITSYRQVMLSHMYCATKPLYYRIALKCLRVNNRWLFAVVLIAGMCGTLLASDWQATGTDSCTLPDFNNTTELLEGLSLPDQRELRIVCLSQSQDCYWNQDSKLSETYCSLCRSVCRSKSMTIDLVQFFVAVLFIHQSGLIGWTAIVSVATDCTPHSLQVNTYNQVFVSLHTSVVIE